MAALVLAGCSSSDQDQQRQLEMMAQHRAGVLSAGLPIEYGPLKVMRVLAKNTVIEIMMIYNQDAQGAKPLNQVLKTSVNSYCTNSEVRANLDMGLAYNIKIRNTRGQLMVEQLISKQTCESGS
nr:GspS/AspS pilotin family protein [Vibrio sp. Isolate30]